MAITTEHSPPILLGPLLVDFTAGVAGHLGTEPWVQGLVLLLSITGCVVRCWSILVETGRVSILRRAGRLIPLLDDDGVSLVVEREGGIRAIDAIGLFVLHIFSCGTTVAITLVKSRAAQQVLIARAVIMLALQLWLSRDIQPHGPFLSKTFGTLSRSGQAVICAISHSGLCTRRLTLRGKHEIAAARKSVEQSDRQCELPVHCPRNLDSVLECGEQVEVDITEVNAAM